MSKLFPMMTDRPARTRSMAGIFYAVICFYTFPFLFLLLTEGMQTPAERSWVEVIYHGINFLVTLWLFGGYLRYAFFNVRYNTRAFLKNVGICAGLMVGYAAIASFVWSRFPGELNQLAAQGSLPIVEMELFNASGFFFKVNPLGGGVCLLILAPVTISCIYYASCFNPVCIDRPWLAYLLMVVYLAIPRALNAITFWPLEQEIILYLTQLPIHLIGCYVYQRTDTVWGPIFTIAIANAAGMVFHILQFGF